MLEGEATRDCAELDVTWARRWPARAVRESILLGFFSPAMDLYTRRHVFGAQHLEGIDGPVVFVANHASHMDTPAILRALPRRWRRRTAVAAAADYFYTRRSTASAVSLVFNTVPLQRRGGGMAAGSTEHLTRIFADGWSLLLYAEGTRSRSGSVGRLRSGAAALAAAHGLPIVPIHVAGTHAAMPPGHRWAKRGDSPGARRHEVEIRFGEPIRQREGERWTEVMERVRLFFAESGAATTLDERVLDDSGRRDAREPVGRV